MKRSIPNGTALRTLSEFNVAAHGLRGIASMMVFFAHILGGTAEHVYYLNSYYVDLINAPWNFGRWGVELFFVISGFVILPSVLRYTPVEFAWRRFLRLYPLFFVFSLLFVLLNSLTNAYPKVNSFEAILSGLLFLNLFTRTEQLTPNAWSLTFEVIFYMFACVTTYYLVRRRNIKISLVLFFVALLFLLRYPIATYFLIGVLTRLIYKFLYSRPDRHLPYWAMFFEIAFFVSSFLIASKYHFSYDPTDLLNPSVYFLMISTGGYFLLAVGPSSITSHLLNRKPILYLGTVSYSLYLAHPYTYFICRKLFERFGFFSENWFLSMGLFFLITVPITLAATHVVHIALERWPYNWFFHQGIYRKPGGVGENNGKNPPNVR